MIQILEDFDHAANALAEYVTEQCRWGRHACWWVGSDSRPGEWYVEALEQPLSLEELRQIAARIDELSRTDCSAATIGFEVETWAKLTQQAYKLSPSLMRPNLDSWLHGWGSTVKGREWQSEIEHLTRLKDQFESEVEQYIKEQG